MKRNLFSTKFYLLFFLFFLLLLSVMRMEKNTNLNEKKPILIAHAGGALDGKTYLNSREAVENSIHNEFQYIELDLLETSDGDIIAAHDWNAFHKLTGFDGIEPTTSVEAKRRKILNNQTVLTSKEINDIFMSHPQLYLVTDKIQNIDLLEQKFGHFKNRIIVEVFSLEKYKEVQRKGFLHAAFCVWNDDALYQLVDDNKIDMITLSGSNLSDRLKWYKKHSKITSFAFTEKQGIANDIDEIKKLFPLIKGWYTDFLTPKMLKES